MPTNINFNNDYSSTSSKNISNMKKSKFLSGSSSALSGEIGFYRPEETHHQLMSDLEINILGNVQNVQKKSNKKSLNRSAGTNKK